MVLPAATARGPASRLSIADLCDVTYALAVEGIERDYSSDLTAAGVAAALGEKVEPKSIADRQREFDEWLTAIPSPVDTEDQEWRQAVGIA